MKINVFFIKLLIYRNGNININSETRTMRKRLKRIAFTACLLLAANTAMAQNWAGQQGNYILTGIPILLTSPDAISSGMGDVGAATTPDIYSSHWNNAKFAFAEEKMAIGTTYTPWMRNLGVSDMNFLYLGGYYRLNNRSAAAASLTYFSLGDILHTDEDGNGLGSFLPNEFALDVTYSMKLTDELSLGASGRFIQSDMTNGITVQSQTTKAARAAAADVGLYYQKEVDQFQSFAAGLFVSNLGSKLRYSDDDTQNDFLPANIRLGGRYTYNIDDYNKINVMLDANKLLVPTPPTYNEETGEYEGRYHSLSEYKTLSSMQGAIYSFMDAPGGLREELSELQISAGAEYWYSNTFVVRGGYFYEAQTKGGRQYITLGAGIRYNTFNFNLSYLIPTTLLDQNPLSNTVRISIAWNMGKNRK